MTFTNGIITTSSNSLNLGSSATVSGAGSGKYVFGNLLRAFATGGSVTKIFDIGDASNYTPVSVSFATVTAAGSITANTSPTDHPQIASSTFNPSRTINRYWTLTQAGITGTAPSAVFTWVPGDVYAGVNTATVYGGDIGAPDLSKYGHPYSYKCTSKRI